MGARKDKIDVDILFDDGMHNVLRSNAPYPILMRRPWNWEATGVLAVNNYDEFLKLVEVIADSYSVKPESFSLNQPCIVVLVGPSGSGKNEIAQELLASCDDFRKLTSYTTDKSALSRQDDSYRYISLKDFRKMCDRGEIFESTTYGHHAYGSRKADVEEILAGGKHVLTVMDICGAMAMKTHFPNVITIYVKRDKKDLLATILEKDVPTPDKVNRIIAIESEVKNAHICDYTVSFENSAQAVAQICQKLNLE
jgi:guanylate kinase